MPRRLSLLSVLCTAVLLTGCHLGLSNHGSVSERGGVLYLDNVPLEHHRELELDAELGGSELRLATSTGPIDVTGVEGGEMHLILDLYSEYEGDGEVRFDHGYLKKRSALDGRLLINGIRGTVPAGVQLHLESGTGRLIVRDLDGQADLDVDTGTGGVFVSGCERGTVRIDTGTGDMRLDDCGAERLIVHSGTGKLVAQDSRLREVTGTSGTGDFIFLGCQIDDISVDSGTGDVRLGDSQAGRLSHRLGTGAVIMKQPAQH